MIKKIIIFYFVMINICHAIPVVVHPSTNNNNEEIKKNRQHVLNEIPDGVLICHAKINTTTDANNRYYDKCEDKPAWNIWNYYDFDTYLKMNHVCEKNQHIVNVFFDSGTWEIYYKCIVEPISPTK